MLASVIVNNFNYARYLGDAIDSALTQTHPEVEVIVVDDGSTDDSRDVIACYGSRVTAVLKENGGQATAFNAGFAASRGEALLFLDADDVLLPTAVECACDRLREDDDVAKVHWPLWVIDAGGRRTGQVWPFAKLSDGDFRAEIVARGPACVTSPPTSGNAWTRRFLERVLPIPEAYGLCADEYLLALSPAFGVVRRVAEPQACYRFHGANQYQCMPMADRIRAGVATNKHQCDTLAHFLRGQGFAAEPDAWLRGMWFPQLRCAIDELKAVVPAGSTFVLLDEDQWGTDASLEGRRRLAFRDRDGVYWGPPPDDAAAIAELERLRGECGASHLVVAQVAAWWLDHYTVFARYVHARFPQVFQSSRMAVFDLAGGNS
jgi:hypothetical protein